MNSYQFYPTPKSLAFKAFSKFNTLNITRLLEPSAGKGSSVELLKEFIEEKERERLQEMGIKRTNSFFDRPSPSCTSFSVDVLEIDQNHIPHLKEKRLNLVGYDFMAFRGAPIYSHIFMNPPFAQGAAHLLHAWDLLYSGEIVCILNSETIRNPYTRERQLLTRIINDNNGSVEFVKSAFETEDAEVKTAVEVAIIHLAKKQDIKSNFIDGLRQEVVDSDPIQNDFGNALALQGDYIQKFRNLVIAFECAVKATKESIISQMKRRHYAKILGNEAGSMAPGETHKEVSDKEFQEQFAEEYSNLKQSAWGGVLRSTEFLNRLSSEGQRRVQSERNDICKLEFNLQNILGFLEGIISSGPEIQIEMICEIFDRITRFHSENRCYYMGWKSNDKHRTLGMKIKKTRFILPVDTTLFGDRLGYGEIQKLKDFDKVFCMLDGRHYDHEDADLAANTQLINGERVSSRYFDLRFYAGVGSLHFFPNRPDLIERMNRIVGKHRNWIPATDSSMTPGFKKQFEQSEKTTVAMRKNAANKLKNYSGASWNRPCERDLGNENSRNHDEARDIFSDSLHEALEQKGIKCDWMLASEADTAAANPKLIIKDELADTGDTLQLGLLA